MDIFDYGIVGGGPAGYTAGIMLAKQGKSVVLFEKDKIGGTCLNRGCIPTKSLLHSSEVYAQLKNSNALGINAENLTYDFSKMVQVKDFVVEKIRKALELSVKNSGVKIIYEAACIKDDNTIEAGGSIYQCKSIITATGSKPREIKGLEYDGNFILSSDDILKLDKLPNTILIIGSGAIGIEWARILSNLDVNVSIVEMADHLIPAADIEVSKRIERIFKQNKIQYFLNDSVENINGKIVKLKSNKELTVDNLLVAVGRVPVRPECCSSTLIGDACAEIQLAHFAIHQAKSLALGIDFNKNYVPSVIYGEPEIAWVGLREQDIDDTYNKKLLPISALGKSWCDCSTDGFIKIITKNDKILGAHIISKEASSLIHILLYAIQNKLDINELKKLCYAHPTYAEGIFDILL